MAQICNLLIMDSDFFCVLKSVPGIFKLGKISHENLKERVLLALCSPTWGCGSGSELQGGGQGRARLQLML